MLAALDAVAIALCVEIDDFLEPRRGPDRPPKLSDAEPTTLAVCVSSVCPTTVSSWRARYLPDRPRDQLRHRARTITGLGARIALRLLAIAAGSWHNHLSHQPGSHLAAYGR